MTAHRSLFTIPLRHVMPTPVYPRRRAASVTAMAPHRAVDPQGVVIDFLLRGRRYLFNGQTGTFLPDLPRAAGRALDALALTPAARRRAWARGRQTEPGLADFLDTLERYRRGTHPELRAEKPQRRFAHAGAPSTFTVYLTRTCNLGCRYCFTRGGQADGAMTRMSPETAQATVAFIRRSVERGVHPVVTVNLFGGEPLLNPEAAYILARGLQDLNHRRLKTKIHILLTTNGTLYNERVFRVLAERPADCAVVVSLDAFKTAHDRNRPFRNGPASSFDCARRTLRRLRQARIPYSATCVVPYPYRFAEAARRLEALGIRRYELKPLLQHQFGRRRLPSVFKQDVALWRRGYLAYTELDLAAPGSVAGVTRVDRALLASNYAKAFADEGVGPVTLACGVADRKIAIDTDGAILPCESYAGLRLGDVRAGFDAARYRAFERRLMRAGQWRIRHPVCRRCFAKRLCGGGCYAQSLDRHRKLIPSTLWQGACAIQRETVKIDLYYLAELQRRHPRLFRRLMA